MVTVTGNFRKSPQIDTSRPRGRKGRQMSRQCTARDAPRLRRRARSSSVLAALCVVAIAAARRSPLRAGRTAVVKTAAAKHPCLVMTGSGDPAFIKNFNPFTATGLPSGQFVRGAIYEGLMVSPEGGKPTLPWLATQLEVEQRQQDPDPAAREGRQVVRREEADVDGRRLQPHRRQAEQGDGHRRLHAPRDRTSPRSRRSGLYSTSSFS